MDAILMALSAVLCLSHVLLVGCSLAPLSFRSEPVSTTQRRGASVHLRCSVRPSSASLSWRFNSRPLELSGLPGVELNSSSLTLHSLQPGHVGHYQCVAHSEGGAIASRYARVAIADIARFGESHLRSLVAVEGSSALIECPLPISAPPALPRWRILRDWLDQSTDEFLILPSGNLQIASVSTQHQGKYKCGAYNPVTRETRVEANSTKVTVKHSDSPHPVQILYPTTPKILAVELSKSLTLECVLAGSSSPTATWLKEGKELALGSGSRKLLWNNLLLPSVRRRDGGNYQCSVQSARGALLSANYTVNVLEPASVLRGLTDQTVSAGSALRFACAVRGNPTPNVTWLFNSEPVSPSPRLQVFDSSLRIAAVTQRDQGIYQCLVDNGIGSAQSSGRLMLQSGLVPSSAVILFPPLSGTFQEGEPVTLSCNASGQPLPVIRWYNEVGPIATHPALLLQPPKAEARAPGDSPPHLTMSRPGSSSLYIQAVTPAHAGKYICEASNILGSVQAEALLSVEPQASSTLQLERERAASEHPIQSDEGEEQVSVETMGPPTESTSDRPTPEAPIIISPPQTHKPDVYDLEWRAGRDWGSQINAYFVKYRKVDDMGNVVGSWQTVRVPGSEKTLRLSELDSSSLYEVLMVARSAAGEGQPAMLTFRTGKEKSTSSGKNPSKAPFVSQPPKASENKSSNTHFGVVIHDRVPEAPDRPTISMASESSVYVTWIPRANGGSPITAFRVEYRRQGRSAEWVVAADNISPLKLSVEVRSLEPGSVYRFRVIAINMYGESPHSATSRPYQVPEDGPRFSDRLVAGPHISSTDAVSDTQIMLRWTYTPSRNNNTPIQGFYIYYRPTDSDNDSDYKKDVVEGLKQWHLIGQLQPETSYDIKMQCFNEGGESEYSNVMICETKARQPQGVPSQHPITPPVPFIHETPTPPGGLLYLIVGCVLGVMVFILLVFIAICLLRDHQQNNMHKYDPPGYLYQPADMNGQVLEYSTMAGTSRLNGAVHGGYGLPQGCHHHHKLTNGLPLLNGSGGVYPSGHAHDGPVEYEHSHPHHLHNGDGLYTPLPQTESTDCMSCQNFCNNNRCYTKTNGTFSSGSLPLMQRVAPCQPDGLEMMPLGLSSRPCHASDSQQQHGEVVEDPEEDQTSPPSQYSCCQSEEQELCTEGERDEEPQCEDTEGPVVCWESLGLPDLDCQKKTGWISSSSLAGELIQAGPQEV